MPDDLPAFTPIDGDPFNDPVVTPNLDSALPPAALRNAGSAVVQGAGNVASHVLDIPRRAFHASEDLRQGGDYDPAPVMEAAGLGAGVGAPFAEVGAAGIFGGRLAAENLARSGVDQPKLALAMADHMAGQGASKEEIYAVTSKMLEGTPYAGVSKGAEGKWRFEIPDNNSWMAGLRDMHLPSVMEHPELFQAYPQLNDVRLTSSVPQGAEGVARGTKEIGVRKASAETPSVPLHEVQHIIQELEGTARGGNTGETLAAAERAYGPRSEMSDTTYNNSVRAAYEAYRQHAGEVEARNVQKRLDMTPDQRRAIPPWATEDVPREQQIVRGVKVTPVEGNPFTPGRAYGGSVKLKQQTVPINRRYDVPYLAGSSNDDKTVYIDRRVPKRIAVRRANRKGYESIDPAEFLAAHELAEHAAMNDGKSYEKAHIENGTVAERNLVKQHGLDWTHYEEVMDGFLSHIEHEKPKRPPPNLYLKPYPHDKAKLLKRLESTS